MDGKFIIRTEKAIAYIFCTLTLLLLGLLTMDLIQFITSVSFNLKKFFENFDNQLFVSRFLA
jgi:hypothetical protein